MAKPAEAPAAADADSPDNGFKDHFSVQSQEYALFRPRYPKALFEWMAQCAKGHDLAWDCATGNGQAAEGLAGYFREVIATDASARQIACARTCAGVSYRVAAAEASGLPAASVDLVCVAQAAHWFDLPRFHAEVRRVLKPGGLIVLGCYERLRIAPALDAVIDDFYVGELGPWWPPERVHVETGYRDLDFPYAAFSTPAFSLREAWTLDQLLGYFSTWSALQASRTATGADPLAALRERLSRLWGKAEAVRAIEWPMSLRAGYLPANAG